MIQSIRHKGLRVCFEKGDSSKIRQAHRKRLKMILTILHGATELKDLSFPGSSLHPLKGELKEYWSISVSGNWRLIFKFMDGDVYDLDYVDYH